MRWLYRLLLRPVLFALDAERAHHTAFAILRGCFATVLLRPLLWLLRGRVPPACSVVCWGKAFSSPVLLAAGFDKDARGFSALHSLGFGGVEVGTLTGQPQPGNPRPRLFRLRADRALLNRMGFNNCGALAASKRIVRSEAQRLGVNIGKTKVVPEEEAAEDYAYSARLLTPVADYVAVNVSSPNTPGLRNLQARDKLQPVLLAVREAMKEAVPERSVPLLVKIAPDLADSDVVDVARLALELGLDGIIATNTTIRRDQLKTPEVDVEALGAGGLSGPLLQARALQVLQILRREVQGRLALISVGGIDSAAVAWERIRAGASLVQIYTAFVYQGPTLPGEIARGLLDRARSEGFETLDAAVKHYSVSGAEPNPPPPGVSIRSTSPA